jgi:hypothetical protein
LANEKNYFDRYPQPAAIFASRRAIRIGRPRVFAGRELSGRKARRTRTKHFTAEHENY